MFCFKRKILQIRITFENVYYYYSLIRSNFTIRLNRAFDYETPEMLRLKNKKNCVLVVYDDDEMIASK